MHQTTAVRLELLIIIIVLHGHKFLLILRLLVWKLCEALSSQSLRFLASVILVDFLMGQGGVQQVASRGHLALLIRIVKRRIVHLRSELFQVHLHVSLQIGLSLCGNG